ncbi:hypothetical protein NQ317_002315 [Molorchus minor]|uniref:Uncharacterized protein n=1 Tax=Molorchus minor TaxID=1323400 RepID=A0ABQ9IPT1_9CUCU|nr:hypothetical protein NQ317_002315 [Molorchus minor]
MCKKRHHTLLHIPSSAPTVVSERDEHDGNVATGSAVQPCNTQGNTTALLVQNNTNSQVLLATACLNLSVIHDNQIIQTLKTLVICSHDMQICGLSADAFQVNKMVDVKIQSRVTDFSANLMCAILDKVTADLPHCQVDTQKLKIPPDLVLADPDYHTSAPIDLLIGADLFYDIILPDTLMLGVNLPIIQHTKLRVYCVWSSPTYYSHHVRRALCSSISEENDDSLSKFWRLEEVSVDPTRQFANNSQEMLCEKLFQEATVLSNNPHTVRLPLIDKNARSLLGGSFNVAVRRFISLEKRSAPYLATRCLIKLADEEGAKYPLAANALRHATVLLASNPCR